MKKLLLICTVVSTLFLSGCNYQMIDTTFAFNKAIIKMPDDTTKTINIKSWTDYEDGEQLQITDKDGRVYLVSSYNCVLIKE